ncbi:MAG: hypothetical protein H6Q13_1009 [Bacteroidetes bacterium]|nr:hypothetical protein [Bacteroidota bacterium]
MEKQIVDYIKTVKDLLKANREEEAISIFK